MPKLIKNEGLSPLKEPEFRRYISARFLFIMSLRMVSTVVAYKLFQLTQSSFAIGLIGCYKGYYCKKGTAGVGKAANAAVVYTSMLLFVIDFIAVFVTNIFYKM